MDAPVRAGTYGPAATNPAASAAAAAADQAVSAAPTASAYPSAQQSAAADQLPAAAYQPSVAGPRLPAVASPQSDDVAARPVARPHDWTGAQSWSPLDSRPAARPATFRPLTSTTPASPDLSGADHACAQAVGAALPSWSAQAEPTASAGPAPSGSDQDDSATDESATSESTAPADESASDESSSGGWAADDWSSPDGYPADGYAADEATWSSNPVTESDSARAAVLPADPRSGQPFAAHPAGTRLDNSPIRVSRVVARHGSPKRALRHQPAADWTGAPALPRPEPDPQPVSPDPSIPSASASGHQGNGGPRGVLAVLPAQPVPAGMAAMDRVGFAGSVPVPGVQDQPINSPD